MKLPPLVARLRVRTRTRSFGLWVPLFLVWMLAFLLAAPLVLAGILVSLAFAPRWNVARLAWGTYAALCETRGTLIDVERDRTRVFMALH